MGKTRKTLLVVAALLVGGVALAGIPKRITFESPYLFKNTVTVEGAFTAASAAISGSQTISGDLSVAGNDINGTGTTTTMMIKSSTPDGVTTATVAGITNQCANITATDACYVIEDSGGTNLLTVLENGNTAIAGAATVGGTLGVTGASALTGALAANGGASIGTGGTAVAKVLSSVTAAIDIGTAGAGVAVTADATVAGAALGNNCFIAPMEDDAAWDEGDLSCFVEGENDVKIVYHADASGGDPAGTNTYRITLVQF